MQPHIPIVLAIGALVLLSAAINPNLLNYLFSFAGMPG
jgi:hypothetical protein